MVSPPKGFEIVVRLSRRSREQVYYTPARLCGSRAQGLVALRTRLLIAGVRDDATPLVLLREEEPLGEPKTLKGNASVREKAQCCPNCDTVMVLHYDPDQADVKWYECSLCGHRTDAESFRSIEDEDIQRRPYAH